MFSFFDQVNRMLINAKSVLVGKSHRVYFLKGGLCLATDKKGDEVFFARLNRHNRYKRGVMVGIDMLAEQYSLDQIVPDKGGLLIDCGANIGELAVWARKNSLKYIGFEPEKNESKCVDLNADDDAKVYRKALWNENDRLVMHSMPNSGDSSVFDMGGAEGSFEIDAVRLDSVVSLNQVEGVVILKVEAEGAEPEVLEGALGILQRVDYVTVDCGPERGKNQDYTFMDVNRTLVEQGFNLCVVKFDRVTALYYNPSRVSCPG